MTIEAILSPPEIDLLPKADLSDAVCVVFDVLRATSSMITALSNGVEKIHPVCTIDEAFELKQQFPDALLGGERHGDKIDGFDLGNSPHEYCGISACRIITTTTNGTVALRACGNAGLVLVGALLNVDVLIAHLKRLNPERILLVCAGTFRELALEDVFAAGAVCSGMRDADLSDSAKTAAAVYEKYGNYFLKVLGKSKNGRALTAAGRSRDVVWCAQRSLFETVGQMSDGVIERVGA